LSLVAEFAYNLHEKNKPAQTRIIKPIKWPSVYEKLHDIRVAVFDVYGTLFNYWKSEFAEPASKKDYLLKTFKNTASYFGMESYLLEMDPDAPIENTLYDLYHGLITLKQNLLIEKNIEYPEIKIEEVWTAILLMLKRRGYVFPDKKVDNDADAARCIAYYYNFHVFNRELYPGVADALIELKKNNIKLGILSNAQFYTSVDLTLLLRNQSNGRIEDMNELFDTDLTFYSYEYNMAKPSRYLFRKLFDALYEYQALPAQTVFVGNDLALDIKPAMDAGMKTALFTGDEKCMFIHGLDDVIPDLTFSGWNDLAQKISFHEEAKNNSDNKQ
jgi:putative hydrolase of the HAD superfamily